MAASSRSRSLASSLLCREGRGRGALGMRGRASRTGAHCRERSRPPTPRGAVGPGARQSAARRLKSRDQSRTDPYALGGERSRCQRGPHRVGSGRKWLTVGLRPTVKSPRAKCWLAARTACCTDTAQIYLDVATTTRPSQTGFCGQGGHANLGFVAKEGTRTWVLWPRRARGSARFRTRFQCIA